MGMVLVIRTAHVTVGARMRNRPLRESDQNKKAQQRCAFLITNHQSLITVHLDRPAR